MEYATHMKNLQILLYDCNIPHKLVKNIYPNKHPNIKMLEFSLRANNITYDYFGATESLVVHDVDPESELHDLCETLIQPTLNGFKIYVHIHDEEYLYDTFNLIEDCLDNILPKQMSYKFIGAK